MSRPGWVSVVSDADIERVHRRLSNRELTEFVDRELPSRVCTCSLCECPTYCSYLGVCRFCEAGVHGSVRWGPKRR